MPRSSLLRRVAAAPAPRLLLLGGLLLLGARLLPIAPFAGAVGAPSPSLAASARWNGPAADDDEVLFRAGSAAVAADDRVVRARLANLARYLELGGTAEEPAAAADDVGLAQKDLVLRRYLIGATRLELARPTAADLPDEDGLRAYYDRNPARFTAPPRVRATQVYLSRTRRGDALASDAARLLAELRARGIPPSGAASLGDPFIRGAVIDGSRDVLARGFGAEFARALEALPAGSWQGPIASPYGLHLVWVEERTPAELEPLEQVRGRAVHALLHERGAQRARARLAALRCHYGTATDCRS
jgi:hypothetical protein